MIGNWKILAAVPFAIALAACSSRSSNTDTAAGSLYTDTATSLTPAPSTPTPGIDTGMVLDTTKKKADTTHADSLKDSTKQAKSGTTAAHKNTKKKSATKKR